MTAVAGFSPDTPPEVRRRVVIVLGLAVLGISSSAVLVRFMEDIGPIALAAWRCLGSGLVLGPGIALSINKLNRRDLGMTAAAGALLGLHFAVWFASLSYTTVMRSTVLVALVPVWTGVLEWAVLGRRPTGGFWLGTSVALAGVALMTGGDFSGGALIGDLLAAVGGVLWSLYFILGRQVRQRVEITAYMGLVCLAAAALLFPLAVVWGDPLSGFTGATWGLIALAIAGPQLIGHQGTNYAVKYLPATVVSTTMLLEPVGATLLAVVFLGEMPGPMAALGGLVVVAGVRLATR
jgi:drug/metabolite transporter (DMT)-like permease